MTKLAPEWVRTSDPVIRSPARYRWTTAPALIVKRQQDKRTVGLVTWTAKLMVSVISYMDSVISYMESVISYMTSVISYTDSFISYMDSVISYKASVIS